MFLNRFNVKSFVLNPEQPKNQFKSLIHFFHIGQFNIMIVLQSGYSFAPEFKNVSHVINFDAPPKYNQYKENGCHVEYFENGSELTLIQPQNDKEVLELYQRKMLKAFSVPNMIKCIPIMWQELLKIKTRVEDVVRTLDNKTVKTEKVNEFKKQLLSNKRLKEYFSQHPEEKEILLNDIQKNDVGAKNRYLFKHLDYLPFYVIPTQVMAVTPEQIKICTTGTQNIIGAGLNGSLTKDKTLIGQVAQSGAAAVAKYGQVTPDFTQIFADPETAQSSLVQNLVALPSRIQLYQSRADPSNPNEAEQTFAYEDPNLVSF